MSKKTNNWDKIFNMIYSLGASIVILGLLGKLARFRWGDYTLYLGLGMEALIFFISAFTFSKKIEKKNLSSEDSDNLEKNLSNPNNFSTSLGPLKLNEELYKSLKNSLEESQNFHKHTKDLSQKMASLNQIYEDMLLALNKNHFSTTTYDTSQQNQGKNDCPDLPGSYCSDGFKHGGKTSP